jgi:competence protein ComEA
VDETSAPWRALESSSASSPVSGAPATGRPAGLDPRWLATMGVVVAAILLAALALWLVVGGSHGSVVVDGDRPVAADGAVGAGRLPGSADPTRLVVDVQGAVVRPGVVELATGSRVGDAIAAAGGFGPRVASDRVAGALNLAALVHDGDQIVVPSRDDPGGSSAGTVAAGGGASGSGAGSMLVDLNHASADELDSLPGIGPATAAKIIAAREEQSFGSVDDLRTRKLVGAATFEKLRGLVTVR